MKNPRPEIENWWAREAMIASYSHVYQVTHKTKYEILALSVDAKSLMEAVLAYPIPDNKHAIIDVFHPFPSNRSLKEQYTKFSHEFLRTGLILGFDLPAKVNTLPTNVFKATSIQQAETANHNLTPEGKCIYVQTLRDKHIHSLYVEHEGEAVGWLQLVTIYPKIGYINQLHVLKKYRNRKYGKALVQHAHAQAIKLGLRRVVLIPSDHALSLLYRRLGYTLLYFSAFQPNGCHHE